MSGESGSDYRVRGRCPGASGQAVARNPGHQERLPLCDDAYSFCSWAAGVIIIFMQENRALSEVLTKLRKLLPLIADRYQVESLGVFGSFVREKQSPESDLDLLVTFHEPPSLLEFIELENYLSDRLGVKVDLVMKDALKPRIGKRILEEVIPL